MKNAPHLTENDRLAHYWILRNIRDVFHPFADDMFLLIQNKHWTTFPSYMLLTMIISFVMV
jgi:hypothetical protein